MEGNLPLRDNGIKQGICDKADGSGALSKNAVIEVVPAAIHRLVEFTFRCNFAGTGVPIEKEVITHGAMHRFGG